MVIKSNKTLRCSKCQTILIDGGFEENDKCVLPFCNGSLTSSLSVSGGQDND